MKKDDFNENKNHEEEKIPLNKKTLKFVLTVITFTLLLSWVLNHTSSFTGIIENILSLLSPFLVGACLAFIINTVMKPLEKLWEKVPEKKRTKLFDKAKRPVCLTFSTIIVFGVVFAVLFMIIPQLVETIASFANMLPQYIKNLEGLLDKAMKALEKYNFVLPSIDLNWSKVGDFLNNFLNNYADSFINKTVDITTSIVTVIVNFVIAVSFLCMFFRRKKKSASI